MFKKNTKQVNRMIARMHAGGMAAVYIGVLGTNNHIGVYITYALSPIASCLYFEKRIKNKEIPGTFYKKEMVFFLFWLNSPKNSM